MSGILFVAPKRKKAVELGATEITWQQLGEMTMNRLKETKHKDNGDT